MQPCDGAEKWRHSLAQWQRALGSETVLAVATNSLKFIGDSHASILSWMDTTCEKFQSTGLVLEKNSSRYGKPSSSNVESVYAHIENHQGLRFESMTSKPGWNFGLMTSSLKCMDLSQPW
mmetsp:Transcript_10596/g.33863  ORF Transcript_10596/g.33863 Transcript_10596/m.33863 type:complete len:120 (+) Transcript_10596:522-881(+)